MFREMTNELRSRALLYGEKTGAYMLPSTASCAGWNVFILLCVDGDRHLLLESLFVRSGWRWMAECYIVELITLFLELDMR